MSFKSFDTSLTFEKGFIHSIFFPSSDQNSSLNSIELSYFSLKSFLFISEIFFAFSDG